MAKELIGASRCYSASFVRRNRIPIPLKKSPSDSLPALQTMIPTVQGYAILADYPYLT